MMLHFLAKNISSGFPVTNPRGATLAQETIDSDEKPSGIFENETAAGNWN